MRHSRPRPPPVRLLLLFCRPRPPVAAEPAVAALSTLSPSPATSKTCLHLARLGAAHAAIPPPAALSAQAELSDPVCGPAAASSTRLPAERLHHAVRPPSRAVAVMRALQLVAPLRIRGSATGWRQGRRLTEAEPEGAWPQPS
ncbi:hypothetical protein B0J12DRAFT_749394 [Macrophomina phaseolina]|uniref:Uncharacterized protein n=1 Tax=Macrophomina phaseolina TaxID=35725 RepID=A0ABQ8GW11_9PEZI|nr:hypothetical protein B0J12DRAFT_749394 [Macrophomina phaseolina]